MIEFMRPTLNDLQHVCLSRGFGKCRAPRPLLEGSDELVLVLVAAAT